MKAFAHANASTLAEAIQLLGDGENARPIAGGTDLIPLLQARVLTPERLVNLKTIPGLDYIRYQPGESLRLGPLARLSAVYESIARSLTTGSSQEEETRNREPGTGGEFGIIAQALSLAASPQLRNAATVAGNLCQRPRCWYFRGPFHCRRRGGETCFAEGGENRYHAILGGFRCHIVHPSDLAPALIALDAEVLLVGPAGERVLPLADFFVGPETDVQVENVLGPAELIAEVRVPDPAPGAAGLYLKAMERQVWAFALASVAVQVAWDGPVARDLRLVLGGVAPVPWRAAAAEDVVRGHAITEEVAAAAARAAVVDARPMEQNAFKVRLTENLVRRALNALEGERRG